MPDAVKHLTYIISIPSHLMQFLNIVSILLMKKWRPIGYSNFFFFFLMAIPTAYFRSPGQGLNPSHSYDLDHSCRNTRSFNPWHHSRNFCNVVFEAPPIKKPSVCSLSWNWDWPWNQENVEEVTSWGIWDLVSRGPYSSYSFLLITLPFVYHGKKAGLANGRMRGHVVENQSPTGKN